MDAKKLFKKIFKKNVMLLNCYWLLTSMRAFFKFKLLVAIKQFRWFLKEYRSYLVMAPNKNFKKIVWHPCLADNLTYTPLEPTYFFQDSWAAKHIFKLKLSHHYDVGSSAKTMAIISQFTPVTMIDIRPIELELDNLFFQEGNILSLPFKKDSLEIISSLCVVEHIGLGRYGDEIDPHGSEKAIEELKRVLMVGGKLLLSVPVDIENKVYFNAHRAFTREYILELFDTFKVLDEKYHYGTNLFDKYDPLKGFGTGLFMLEKMK